MLHAPYTREADDRTKAIIAATLVEQQLEDALVTYFKGDEAEIRRKMFDGDNEREGILSGLASKAWTAHFLGMFGKTLLDDINMFRLVRNTFAHSPVHVDFDTDSIKQACEFASFNKDPDIRDDQVLATAQQCYMGFAETLCIIWRMIAHSQESKIEVMEEFKDFLF